MYDFARILDEKYQLVEEVKAIVVCGEDFCDGCGDCLACYGGDPCYHNGSGAHSWYVYAHNAEKWRAGHVLLSDVPESEDA